MNLKEIFFCCTKKKTVDSYFARGLNIVITFFILAIICNAVFCCQIYDWQSVFTYREVFEKGWLYTCLIAITSLGLSFLIGTVAALMRRSKLLLLKYLAHFYIESIRGTPLLVQLLVFFYVVGTALHIENRFFIGVFTLSLFSGAYIAEIVRSGLDSIRSSHLDSAKAIGMSTKQTYRHVIFPLAFRQILPPLTGQFASIIKDSSLLSILGISEFTYSAQQVSSATYSTLESYIPLALGYLVLTLPISLLSKTLEKRFRYES